VTPANRPITGAPAAGPSSAIGPIDSPLQASVVPAPSSRLVAARVSGGIDFLEGTAHTARPRTASIPMYAHPADRNAAATSVSAGRLVDLTA
jgi:hypothetical protein